LKQSQSDGTAAIFAIAGAGEDFSPEKAKFARSKNAARKIPSINFLVIFFTSFRPVDGLQFKTSLLPVGLLTSSHHSTLKPGIPSARLGFSQPRSMDPPQDLERLWQNNVPLPTDRHPDS
jgi:hypothetical protein